ncbi:MAG TPA: hypothetical protein VFY21_05705 [Xanthobacteraceae bacterium]|nr:hypothetical protein [Xanthobacteraceae bacterium]
MPNNETNRDRQERRIDADLHDQYRPIGIGAVAGALSAGRTADDTARGAPAGNEQRHERESSAANSNERQHERESLAA